MAISKYMANNFTQDEETALPQADSEQVDITSGDEAEILTTKSNSKTVRRVIWILTQWIGFLAFSFLFILAFLFNLIPFAQNLKPISVFTDSQLILSQDSVDYQSISSEGLLKNIEGLRKNLASKTPKNTYLIINTIENKFQLWNGNTQLRKGLCSTGSYTILKKSDLDKQWIFKTPRGVFKIRGKTQSPVWVKPDWAFIEEGLPVPSPRHPSRYDNATLGDYSLSLGDGYMIHGTLYKRFLGMPVTHGCVRMGDEDLEAVYNNMPVGSKVYIY
jgi:L,D-transpeptidase YbiS